jgi:nucleoside phosphorylase
MEVPFTALKAITDLVDHHEETAEQFDRNLALAIDRLAAALAAVVEAVTTPGE